LSDHFLVPKFVYCIGSCHFPASITISHGLAICVANLIANSLSGMINNSSHACISIFWISFVSSFSIASLFSVSGSSSVAIAISAYFWAIFHISGLLVLSLFPGAPNTTISFQFHFRRSKNFSVLSKASAE